MIKGRICTILSLVLLCTFAFTVPASARALTDQYQYSLSEMFGEKKESLEVLFMGEGVLPAKEYSVIQVPEGAELKVTSKGSIMAILLGYNKKNGILDEETAVPWNVNGTLELINLVKEKTTVTAELSKFDYYQLTIWKNGYTEQNTYMIQPINRTDITTPDSTQTPTSTDSPANWAIEGIKEATSKGLIPEVLQKSYTSNITREEFCNLLITLIEVNKGESIATFLAGKGLNSSQNPFTDTTDAHVIAANQLGIVSGKSAGLFDPNGSITRQEAAVMLMNSAKALGQEIITSGSPFADEVKIANWAKDSVRYVSAKEIMTGTGNNTFSPSTTFTRQQAFITMLNLYKLDSK